jgi:hypothetical protein
MMKSKTWLVLLAITAVLLFAYSGKFTSSSFSDGKSSTDNILRIQISSFLGSADNFVVLAGSGITNTGPTTITGDVGTYSTTTETGFGSVTLTGTDYAGNSVTQAAKTDLTTAYNDAAGRTPVTVATELGGTSPVPGVYNSTDGTFVITGTLTLTGNATDVWIFQTATTLITAASSQIIMGGTAKEANVYWVVGSSATLGTATKFVGNILALTSITLNTGAEVRGRVLACNGAVTLAHNIITKPDP